MAGIATRLARDREAAQGLGSHERAVKYLNQDYATLRDACLEAGTLFQDPCFPALAPSLGFKELGPYSSKTRGIEWKRPTVGGARRGQADPGRQGAGVGGEPKLSRAPGRTGCCLREAQLPLSPSAPSRAAVGTLARPPGHPLPCFGTSPKPGWLPGGRKEAMGCGKEGLRGRGGQETPALDLRAGPLSLTKVRSAQRGRYLPLEL